jgi:hypothetical protein
MAAVHIYAPRATAKVVSRGTCPDCKLPSRFLAFFTPWHGWDSTCIRCGRHFQDGYWLPLPFISGQWLRDRQGRLVFLKPRAANVALAKRRWRAMPPVTENHYGCSDV